MLLTKVKVKNYLSVNGECELPIDPRVSVLLGANDHGKSNLLRALEHLNYDNPISKEEQNWDSQGPAIEFTFQFSDEEVSHLKGIASKLDAELAVIKEEQSSLLDEVEDQEEGDEEEASPRAPISPATPPQALATAPTRPAVVPGNSITARLAHRGSAQEEDTQSRDNDDVEDDIAYVAGILKHPTITLMRDGVNAPLTLNGADLEGMEGDLGIALEEMIPRVELFRAFSGELQDSVKASEIKTADAEFLQGIFFYAGLNPMDCEELFEQTDETDKQLEEASLQLDKELRQLWGQGVDLNLHFQLRHFGSSIELLANDPAVKKRHARMSKRSAGVTQFFRLSMVLHARRKKNPANSYIYVFDEPGVFLHPKGQKDLLAVFEQLAEDTQIIYATHSLFMLNQNFPERHRLIMRNDSTTVVDSKPYKGNWRIAVDALGVRLTSNILFSPNILLVEGDSDPLYIFELFRALNRLGRIDADANLIGVVSYSDLPNLRFLLQIFRTESADRRVMVLLDGDSAGKAYQKATSALCKKLSVETQLLESGTSIEDYCIYPSLFMKAVEEALRISFEASGKAVPNDLEQQIQKSYAAYQERKMKLTAPAKSRKQADGTQEAEGAEPQQKPEDSSDLNSGKWFKDWSEELLDGGSSKVALARNYSFLCRESQPVDGIDEKRAQRSKALLDSIVGQLKLPSLKAKKAFEQAS